MRRRGHNTPFYSVFHALLDPCAALSEWVYSAAGEGRELRMLDGATHSLRQRRGELRTLLLDWLDRALPSEV